MQRRLPARRRGAADLRARRPGGRGRPPDRHGRRDRPAARRHLQSRSRESEAERLRFWAGRKDAFPAVGRISPDYYCMDGTIPRSAAGLRAAARCRRCRASYGLRVANVFHAGDGNLHPLILYDANKPGELERGRGVRRRHPQALRRGRRRAHRRARRGRREARPDARPCSTRTTSNQQQRVKCAFDPGPDPQSGQGLPGAAPLRRAGPDARAQGRAPVSGAAAVLGYECRCCCLRNLCLDRVV